MRYKIKVCRDLIRVENSVGTKLMILQHLSYINFYTLKELRFLCFYTQVELVVVHKESCIINTDVLWFYTFKDMTDVLRRVPTFGLYLFFNTAEKLCHEIRLSASDHSFFHSRSHSPYLHCLSQSVSQSVCYSVCHLVCQSVCHSLSVSQSVSQSVCHLVCQSVC